MKLLIDNALPPKLAELLVAGGFDAVHVRRYGMQAAADEQILARALVEDRVVVSADSDFGTILATQRADRPSFILFREPGLVVAEDFFNVLHHRLIHSETGPGERVRRSISQSTPGRSQASLRRVALFTKAKRYPLPLPGNLFNSATSSV